MENNIFWADKRFGFSYDWSVNGFVQIGPIVDGPSFKEKDWHGILGVLIGV